MTDVIQKAEEKPKSSTSEFEIPFDVLELPSKGKLYKTGSLAGKDSLEVHYLTALQEDILTSPNLIKSGKMLDVLLKSVLKDKSIEPNDMLLGDRNAIIVWLRATGYGEEYPVVIECGSCGESYKYTFDLNKLETRELTTDADENGLFNFTLPVTKKNIKFGLLTVGDENAIAKLIEERKTKLDTIIDNSLSLKMFQMIKEIGGNTDRGYIKKFVESMPVKDAVKLRSYINEIEPGIIMMQESTCLHCGKSSMEVMPIQANFFWPSS